ncbi:metal ABC transporter permease [Luteolibacter sp. Populi]|uniref:metal ABC transporter permease n=1 Tax=Luteolibacter sp. Populi TaxID=3230487 RepID=UPI003466D094
MMALLETTAEKATLAALLLGISGGLTGVFVVSRRMALTGDMLSHAVLPGVVAGLLWSPDRNPLVVLACAVAAGLLGTGLLMALMRTTKLKPDAALGVVLSVFFAAGIAMISKWKPGGVNAYLFGQAAAISDADLWMLAATTGVIALGTTLGFRVLTVASFDPRHARLLGIRVGWVDRIFFIVLAASVVVAMQAVGVVLVSALLVTPAVAAGRVTRDLAAQACWACGFGVIGSIAGVQLSLLKTGLPTGPLMALSLATVLAFAILFGIRDGVVWRWFRARRLKQRIDRENVLKAVWSFIEDREGGVVGLEELARKMRENLESVRTRGARLVAEGEAEWTSSGSALLLTVPGRRRAAEIVRKHRLWELYLTRRADYAPDHVHDDADRAEHWISEENVRRLAEVLENPEEDPHGRKIPRGTGEEGK